MEQEFYLNRKVYSDDTSFTEAELLNSSKWIVVLAEPGAGKTALLKSLARQLGIKEVTANVFSYIRIHESGLPLVIDAFDELARIDQMGINKLLATALETKPTHIVISSRSSEWDNTATILFEQFFGSKPTVVRLSEFDESEQEKIFENYTSRRDFSDFQREVSRFSLEPILPNPQFLKLFADAYIESNGHFSDRNSIFSQAVIHLTKESSETTKSSPNVSIENKVEWASEVFTNLLLSGAEGVAKSEAHENRNFPLLASLIKELNTDPTVILATKLFKPDSIPDLHRPVHKIVAEYCSAKNLTNRIIASNDDLTLDSCLTVIAPNQCVRDELRGLLGWMAALGTKQIQSDIIELDPYAVLANGDPSQLAPYSKRLLLSKLKEVEANDPFFRRSDFNRRFSVVGFFTQDILEEIRLIITAKSDSELRNLLLELLVDSNPSQWLEKEYQEIVTSPSESKRTRLLANDCLMNITSYDYRIDFEALISEASSASLNVATNIIENFGPAKFEVNQLEAFFRASTNLYEGGKSARSTGTMERYFLKRIFPLLSLSVTEQLLNLLSEGLMCTCNKKYYDCSCRIGISKIIGSLLDHYFKLAKPPFDALAIWGWIKNLNFTELYNTENMLSVMMLKEDRELKEGIIEHYFGSLWDPEEISAGKFHGFSGRYSHAGLTLIQEDYKFIVDLAFRKNNTILWDSFMLYHWHYDKENRGPVPLRTHMRKQASEKPEFMRVWVRVNRRRAQIRQQDQTRDKKHRRLMKRRENKKLQINAENIKYVQKNREIVEGGRHWRCLIRFADLVLNKPEEIIFEFGDEKLVRSALRNCHEYIESHIPSLQKLVELQCASQGLHVETILFASCLEILRKTGNLENVKPEILFALRTHLNMGYSAVEEEEKEALKAEVDRLIFPSEIQAEQFLREYLEPQLLNPECTNAKVGLLEYDQVFAPIRTKLSIEWLSKINNLNYNSLTELFGLVVEDGESKAATKIIKARCSQLLATSPTSARKKDFDEKCKFWFIRAFYFLSLDEAQPYWNKIKSDRNAIFMFDRFSGHWNRGDHKNWPPLNAVKVEAILNAFFIRWRKVHLPTQYGSDSPEGENAYRFLTEIIWAISSDTSTEAIPVLDRLLNTHRYSDIHMNLKGIKAELLRKNALKNYTPPSSSEIKDLLNNNAVVSVEGLRNIIIQELISYQKDIDGGEFNAATRFYSKSVKDKFRRLGEVASVEIIAERLSLKVESKGISIVSEHQTKNQNRIDITATKMINGKRRLLVIEAKGQWHADLYSAASTQLYERYSIHPSAEHQGIYLVIWFGTQEKVANKKNHEIKSAKELKEKLENELPANLKGLIDIIVLDVSCPR
jgi:tRNA A37 threonylcarbamoyladenosine biosynthesis protein TsaE